MRAITAAALAAAFVALPAHAATPNLKEGLWEITVKMEMAGMPGGMPPHTARQCITRKDLDDPQKLAPQAGPQDERCQVSDYTLKGNTATWKWTCKGRESMSGAGTMTFAGSTYSGVNKMTMTEGGHATHMTIHYSGRHIGTCK